MLGQTAAAEIEGASQQDAGLQVTYRVYRAYMGDCQNYGPFLGPYYNTGPNLGDSKKDHNFDDPPHGLLGCSGLGLWGLGIRV